MTTDEQIQQLNETVKCTLKPSNIHGIGVFALRDIKKGEDLYCLRPDMETYTLPLKRMSELRPEILSLILDRWPQTKEGRPFLSPNSDAHLMSFMNHSPEPNSQDGYAVRDIKAGEEVTEDYDTENLSDIQQTHYNFI